MRDILDTAVGIFAQILYFLVFIRCLISWFPISHDNKLLQLLYALTEPILAPIRNMVYKSPLGGRGMMIDFSPIIALFFLDIARRVLQSLISYIPF